MAKYDEDLSRLFKALSDPTRRAMLVQLGAGPLPLAKLAAPSGHSLPTAHRHLAVLEEAGLVTTLKQGRTRLCAARPEAMERAQGWMDQTRQKWAAQTDRIADYLEKLQRTPNDI